MEDSSRTSQDCTSSRDLCASEMSRLSRNWDLVPERSERAVATMGTLAGVVLRRWRVRAKPMPREDGVISVQAMMMGGSGEEYVES